MVRHTAERPLGQVLVVVALGLVALVAFVGLAVDGGNLYSQRRAMQNAADAGALAGAGEICYGNPAIAATTAISYATHLNGADEDATTATVDGHIVTVDAGRAVDTFFARIIGFQTLDVQASARAACGRAVSAAGLWPVALPADLWAGYYQGNTSCGERFRVWDNAEVCSDLGCAGASNRGWLDFTSSLTEPFTDVCSNYSPGQASCDGGPGQGQGQGTNELFCRLVCDNSGEIRVPGCVDSKHGTAAAALTTNHGAQRRINDIVLVPVYDTFCNNPDGYHIVKFACVRVVSIGKDGNRRYIEVEVDCEGCATSYGSTDGEFGEEWEVRAVSLIQ